MKTKAEIQNTIDDLQRQSQQYTERRADLVKEGNKLSASIDAQTQNMGVATIEGKDITKASDALARDRLKLDSINTAIEQIDAWLADFERQTLQARVDHARVDFDRLNDEADALFVDAVNQYQAAYASLQALDAKFAELAGMGQAAGRSVDNHDHLRMMRGAYHHLLNAIKSELSILNDTCARLVAEVRLR